MRINLTDGGKTRPKRRKGKGRGSRGSRTFDSSIALPSTLSQGLTRTPKAKERARDPKPQRQVTKHRGPERQSRARRRQQATQMEQAERMPRTIHIQWRAVLARMPMLVILLALMGGAAYASTDARFFVYDSRIVGARHLEAETIYEAAGIHEQNIFWIQPSEVARRVIQVEGIQVANVTCSLPAQVVIEVEEREPIVLWRSLSQERDWWLDKDGVVLPYHGDVNSPETVFVIDSSERHLEVGHVIEPKGIVGSVRQLAAALPEVNVVFYDADRGLSFLYKRNGGEWPVYVGSSEDLTRKIQVVQILTDYLMAHDTQPRYIDVRWADHPVFGKPSSE